MARDAAMLAAVGGPGGPDRLARVFEWATPALSLGRSARAGGLDRERLARAGIAVVRRPTGGGALVHGTDVSFSIALRRTPQGGGPDLVHAGRGLAAPVRAALASLGFPAVFRDDAACDPGGGGPAFPLCMSQRAPFDLLVDGRKVAAFALRRTATALFLHGSIHVSRPALATVEALREAGGVSPPEWMAALAGVAALADWGTTSASHVREALAAAV